MALIKCSECRREIGAEAGACPHCGAPLSPLQTVVPRSAVAAVALIGVAVVAIGIYSLWTPSPAAAVVAAPASAVAPSKPTHYYTWHRGHVYGYELEQSEFSREHGQAPPAITYTYEGQQAGVFHLRQFNGRFMDVVTCSAPCETVRITNAQIDGPLKLRPMTPLWAAIQDMLAGQLEP